MTESTSSISAVGMIGIDDNPDDLSSLRERQREP